MNQKKKIILISVITGILFLAFAFIMIKMLVENGECIDDPFGYSAKRLRESGGNYDCVCLSLDPGLLDFFFNEDGIEIIERKIGEEPDISRLDIIEMKGGELN